MKCHINISFTTLECVWEFDVEINYKEITGESMVYAKKVITHAITITFRA
jgi:hypothetical protein